MLLIFWFTWILMVHEWLIKLITICSTLNYSYHIYAWKEKYIIKTTKKELKERQKGLWKVKISIFQFSGSSLHSFHVLVINSITVMMFLFVVVVSVSLGLTSVELLLNWKKTLLGNWMINSLKLTLKNFSYFNKLQYLLQYN